MPKTLCIKVKKESAQKIHKALIANNLFCKSFSPAHEGEYVFFPIKKGFEKEAKKFGKTTIFNLQARAQSRPLLPLFPFDIIGSIAVLEIPKTMQKEQKKAAMQILSSNKNIKTVAIKSGATKGKYRIRKITPIAGIKTTKTIATESGCRFCVDLNRAYYTPRLSHERLRIASQIKNNENILALFSGICPYPIVLEKNAKNKPNKIIAIELNPQAHKMAMQNILLNKCKTITALHADAKAELKTQKLKNWANRIIMPHPSEALKFFPYALNAAKKGCIIHLYSFCANEENAYKKLFAEAKALAIKKGISIWLLGWRIARPYSSTLQQLVLDIKVL